MHDGMLEMEFDSQKIDVFWIRKNGIISKADKGNFKIIALIILKILLSGLDILSGTHSLLL